MEPTTKQPEVKAAAGSRMDDHNVDLDVEYVDELDPIDEEAGEAGSGGRKVGLLAGAAVFVGVLLLIGLVPRMLARSADKNTASTALASETSVDVIPASAPAPYDAINLPGNVQAIDQTSVVARASGYVKQWFADIGDHVKAGQTLAIIDTPDLEQQLAQAEAQVAQAQAAQVQALANVSSLQAKVAEGKADISRAQAGLEQAKTDRERAKVEVAHGQEAVARQQAQLEQGESAFNLAKVTSDRYQGMLSDGAVDQETADQALATYKSSQSNVDALKAALRAAREDVRADQDEVMSAGSNINAYESALQSRIADVQSDDANVKSGYAAVTAAQANVRANQANVDRLRVLSSFNKVTAPFSGVITARNIDTGTLIAANGSASGNGSGVGSSVAGASGLGNAASGSSLSGASSSSGGGQTSLYSIARIDRLRVYINVPQSESDVVRVGQSAALTVSALPGKTFTGTIVRTADALDPISRTLVTEVRFDNHAGDLRPGMFVQVSLSVPHPVGSVLIPDAALVTNGRGSQVQVVRSDGTVHFQRVSIGRDFGKVMEITSGLDPGQRIVASAMDSLQEGQMIRIANIEAPVQASAD